MDGAYVYNLEQDLVLAQAEIARLTARLDQAEATLRTHEDARWRAACPQLHPPVPTCDGVGVNERNGGS